MNSFQKILLAILLASTLIFAGCNSSNSDTLLDNDIEIESDQEIEIIEADVDKTLEEDLLAEDEDIEIGELI